MTTRCVVAALACLMGLSTRAQAQPEAAPNPLRVFGDVRLRLDVDTRSQDGADDDFDERRTRPRLRARFGLHYTTAVKGLSFGMRLATNPGTPGNSPHQNFSLSEANVFALDRAFIQYEPTGGLVLLAGKQGWPHWQQTEVFWDDDIQPEGFAATYARDLGTSGKVGANAGYFYLVNNSYERQFELNDILATWQLRWAGAFGTVSPTLAITGAHVQDNGEPSNVDTADVRDASFYLLSAQVKSAHGKVTLTAGVDVAVSDVDSEGFEAACVAPCEDWSETTGFVAQLRAAYDTWGARYYFYSVGEAAVPFYAPLGSFTQDNFPSSAASLTGFTGHRIQFDRAIGNGVSADLRIYLQSANDNNVLTFAEPAGRSTNRYQLNLNAKF